jgi:UDP-2,3-diacylglucosamine hydrolase
LTSSKPVTAYFISDAHLGREGPVPEEQKLRLLLEFFQEVSQSATHLFVVGDLFDFWFEWRWVIPKETFPVLARLKSLVDQGIEVHYLAGNHDFHLLGFLEKEVGVVVHPYELDIRLDGKRFYLYHGDGLLAKDKGYRVMRRIIRHPWSVALYRLVHPDLGIAIAKLTSKLSRKRLALRYSQHHEEEYNAFVLTKLRAGYDVVMMGHSHWPAHKEFPEGVYINLGDWMEKFTYARWNGEAVSLHRWSQKTQFRVYDETNGPRYT